jgi:hypothetical protein
VTSILGNWVWWGRTVRRKPPDVRHAHVLLRQVFGALLVFPLVFACAQADSLVTGPQFRKQWDAPLSVTWPGIELRTALGRLIDARDVAILLDRRIDPTTEIRLERQDTSLGSVVADVALESRTGLSVMRHVVYLGPSETARRLRTVVAIRESELSDAGIASASRTSLVREQDFAWEDLAEPRDLVAAWCQLYGLEPVGVERVPHDLWGAGRWPNLTAAEGLTLLLAQFELGYEWRVVDGRVTGIVVTSLLDDPRLDRSYSPPRGTSPEALAETWRAERPLAKIEPQGKQVGVAATVEDHEYFATLLKSGSRSRGDGSGKTSAAGKNADAIEYKRFTLKLDKVPAQALLDTLARNGDARLTYSHDRAAFEAAGKSFTKRISVDVKNATIDTLLEQIADELQVEYVRDDRAIQWTLPAKPAPPVEGVNP